MVARKHGNLAAKDLRGNFFDDVVSLKMIDFMIDVSFFFFSKLNESENLT